MRVAAIAVCLLALPVTGVAAPTWQLIASDSGRRIELDSTSIKREENKVTALGRVMLDKEILDDRSGANYRIIESLTRYDCSARNAATLKRVFKKNENEVLREEEFAGTDMPIRTGTLDDKILREVCRPGGPKLEVEEVLDKANAAAAKLREANAVMLKQALAQDKARSAAPRPRASAEVRRVAPPRPEAQPQPQPRIEWSYYGAGSPEHWGRLDPANKLCGNGRRQSPIDIRDGIRVDLEPIRFDYQPSRFRITDTGRTLEVLLAAQRISLIGKTYVLDKIQFHRPAEIKIGGRQYDMAAHLIHRAADGQLAIVAIPLERGSEHPVIQTLWNYLPLERGEAVMPPEANVDLAALLPENRKYYTFMGSLTTPPCTEGVLWLVLQQAVQISEEQIRIFSRLHPHNARPIQPSFGRLIKEGR